MDSGLEDLPVHTLVLNLISQFWRKEYLLEVFKNSMRRLRCGDINRLEHGRNAFHQKRLTYSDDHSFSPEKRQK